MLANMFKKLWLFLAFALLCCSCCRTPAGHIKLNFSFVVDKDSLRLDTCMYQNAAGNFYEVNDVQFFISHVRLETSSGEVVEIADNQGIHYTDIRIPGTLTWNIADIVPADEYKSISFVFGLEGEQNTTGYFPNSPENNMSWPDIIGGGYHYMKINGRWIDRRAPALQPTHRQNRHRQWFCRQHFYGDTAVGEFRHPQGDRRTDVADERERLVFKSEHL